ncbi:hypothetical protein Cgig2_017437 [Carnegiea gigantea]|uniref:HTH myb-type domain-containing protein n=1 Tax=Carnegiea gigantea TaxID=171969 RepID=A0A9Q1K4J8_9CARY|nr:hypothetical protein Cgig2_017437 [Carnegiea gigantea]
MLAVSSLTSNNDGHKREVEETMEANFTIGGDEFPDFSGGNLLDSIDFDDLFMSMQDCDVLPDLEMDPELLAEFSFSGGEESEANNSSVEDDSTHDDQHVGLGGIEGGKGNNNNDGDGVEGNKKREQVEGDRKGGVKRKVPERERQIESRKDQESESTTTVNSSFKEGEKGKKSSSLHTKGNNNDNNQGKRKPKVDWTPELHRRFVQAVEQLGVDKAVPSRILELMGIDCLTRHNIASHLQKYRSHRKHLLAREAEAASWTQKRQMYGIAVGGGKGGGANVLSPWHPPTMGFPPMTTMHPSFRPLHVWGHPTMDPQARMPMWPKQVVASPASPVPQAWTVPPPHPPTTDLSFWHAPHQRVPSAMTPAGAATHCFPQPLPATRFTAPPVPGIPPHAMYRQDHGNLPLPPAAQPGLDLHPSKESLDAAIGDVLAKPWLPLPIGLKPPSTDSVLVQLQRQGIPKIPPTSTCA